MMASSEEKPVMIVGVDRNVDSFYALEWTLDRFFAPYASNPPFKLIVVHAKPSFALDDSLLGTGAERILLKLEEDAKKIAARVTEISKETCLRRSVNDAIIEVVEGDARNVLCEIVEKRNASLLVVGSGYGDMERIGGVCYCCVHHAHCSVMIVKKPDVMSCYI